MPSFVSEYLATPEEAARAGIEIRLWDPATQLRHARTADVPGRPDGAPNRWPAEAPATR